MAQTIDTIKEMPTKASSADHWILWHKALKSEFGRDKAAYTFLKAFSARGTNAANNEQLREYLKKEGINLEADWQDSITGFISNPFGFSDIFTSARTTVMLVVILLLIFAGFVVYKLVANPDAAIRIASVVTPAGRLAGAGSKLITQ